MRQRGSALYRLQVSNVWVGSEDNMAMPMYCGYGIKGVDPLERVRGDYFADGNYLEVRRASAQVQKGMCNRLGPMTRRLRSLASSVAASDVVWNGNLPKILG
ncbi:MAG: hypothetical protein JWR75_1453 [Devosia sp.]|nr:hypothetical protein [Devosia sp.]